MRVCRFLPVLMLALAVPATADIAFYRDQPKSYVASNIFMLEVDGAGIDQTPGGVLFRLGGMVDRHFGAEVRLGRGLWHESQPQDDDSRLKISVDHVVGVYGTARLPFDVPLITLPLVDKLFVHALVGAADVQLRSELTQCDPDCSRQVQHNGRTDLSWGVGMGMELALPKIELPLFDAPRRIGLSLEYMHYGSKYDVDLNAIEAGVMVFF
jgi:hypothetical protein